MEKTIKLFITFAFLVILISGLYIFTNWFSIITGYFVGEDEKAQLANCLSGQGAEFYDSEFCADCEKQKQLFGKAISLIHIIDCGKEKELCPNIKSVPAWYINKKIHYGFKNITELQQLSNCIPKSD